MIATLILALYLLGGVDVGSAVTLLYIVGAILIAAELFLGVFGFAALNGLIALYIGYSIKIGEMQWFGLPIDWGLFFGIAFFEIVLLVIMITMIIKLKKKPITNGTESMIGQVGTITDWKGDEGHVQIQGESWKAISTSSKSLKKNDKVTIESVDDLVLTITPSNTGD